MVNNEIAGWAKSRTDAGAVSSDAEARGSASASRTSNNQPKPREIFEIPEVSLRETVPSSVRNLLPSICKQNANA